ncbi:response regulator transcription factor [Pseudooceanicola sp.]|jgi:DNA-binding NarL/FixJ family response regulator|uniref:response regulator transcription factor n=1 Tax=Pseudooceanicola sp. TaxID=1914328 RepID=UPI00405804F0
MANIILADDHALVLEAISHLLTDEGLHVVHPAASVRETEALIADGLEPDLVLLDYRMPDMHDLAGLLRIRTLVPGVPVALISGSAGGAVASAALDAGAAGFLPKTLTRDQLLAAVQVLLSGGTYQPDAPAEGSLAATLTRREYDVLRGVAQGLSNKEIARSLDLTEVTVKLHVKTMCRKLDARNRTHAAMLALELGLL